MNHSSPTHYLQYMEQKQIIKFNYNDKQAKAMKKNADNNNLVGDELLKRGEQCMSEDNHENAKIFFTSATKNFVQAVEKKQKAALVASGNRDAAYPKVDKKIITSHNNSLIRWVLKENANIELISQDEAKMLDKIHGGNDLAHIGLEYPDTKTYKTATISYEDCLKAQKIAENANINYNKLIKQECRRSVMEAVNKTINNSSVFSRLSLKP